MNSECIVCRMRQALDMCKFVNADEEKRQQVLQTVMEILLRRNEIETDDGEIGVMISSEIKRILGEDDPYKSAKEESIRKALEIYPRLKDLVRASSEPLLTAVEICIAGNVIDFGPSSTHNIESAIEEVIASKKTHFDWDAFKDALEKSSEVLILADNAGETVFDRVLIEEMGKPVKYVVKSAPALNDAMREDAVASGLEGITEIIENGSQVGGTVLSNCSKEF
ncbi:MAG: DUF89 family protein, partial [Anaerolineaceae bacterium]|nr:DUF89 family protein [Anaerolineaceae bacterium]